MLDGLSETDKLLQIVLSAVQKGNCLVQLWQRTRSAGESETIQTQKCAVALAGDGERLSAYRKLCCRYVLSTDTTAADPVCLAWQSQQIVVCKHPYLGPGAGRGQDGRTCGIQAACFVPVLAPARGSHPIAVIEAALDRDATFPLAAVQQQLCLAAETAGLLVSWAHPPLDLDNLQQPGHGSDPEIPADSQASILATPSGQTALTQAETNDAVAAAAHAPDSPAAEAHTSAAEPSLLPTPGNADQAQLESALQSQLAKRCELRLEDIQQHFTCGLREAATRLGICTTTLKRLCRQYGINRWPRRELLRKRQIHIATELAAISSVPASSGVSGVPAGPSKRIRHLDVCTSPVQANVSGSSSPDAGAQPPAGPQKVILDPWPEASASWDLVLQSLSAQLHPAQKDHPQSGAPSPTPSRPQAPSPVAAVAPASACQPRGVQSSGAQCSPLQLAPPASAPVLSRPGGSGLGLQHMHDFEVMVQRWMRQNKTARHHPLLASLLGLTTTSAPAMLGRACAPPDSQAA